MKFPTLSILCAVVVASVFAGDSSAVEKQISADRADAELAYAQCIRDNGYGEFPDPQPDGGFQFLIDPQNLSRFKAAAAACRSLSPEGMRDEDISPQTLEALLKLSQCVRENGVADFPDPTSDGRFDLSGTSIKPGDARVDTAMAACKDLADRAGRIVIGG